MKTRVRSGVAKWLNGCIGACALSIIVAGCGRSEDQSVQAPVLNRPPPPGAPRVIRTPRMRPPMPEEWPAEPETQFPSATVTCQTRASETPSANAASTLLKAETSPAQIAGGTSPELLLTIQHDPHVREIRVHLEINKQTQNLSAKLEAAPPAKEKLDSRVVVKFPALPGGTLVRDWLELSDGAGTQRLPAKDAPSAKLAFYVQDRPNDSKIPLYELKMERESLMALEQSTFSNETVPAVFIANGEVYDVRVRYRGAWARSWPKKPLKIFFSKDKPFEGEHCLNLNSAWRDPAMVRECVAYHIFSTAGVPASKAKMVRLHLNNGFRGLYVAVQQPDKAFLSRFDLKGATLFKSFSRSNQGDERDLGSEQVYSRNYEKQNQKDSGYQDLKEFCHELASTTDVEGFFNKRVQVDCYIDYLAATAFTQNWDGFNKNHYLIYDGKDTRKWLAAPWDLDRTLGDHWNWSFSETRLPLLLGTRELPGVTGWNRMQDRFLKDPKLRARFLDRLNTLLQTELTEEKLFPYLDQLEASIAPEAAMDRQRWPAQSSDIHAGIEQLKDFVRERRAFLAQEITRLRRGA